MNKLLKGGLQLGVNNKLISLFFVIIILILGIFTWFNYYQAQQKTINDNVILITNAYTNYESILDEQLRTATAVSLSLSEREDVKQMMIGQDMTGLTLGLTPVYDALKSSNYLTHINILDPNGNPLLIIEDSNQSVISTSFQDLIKGIANDGLTHTGTGITSNGVVVMSISPIYDQGALIGMIGIDLNIDQSFLSNLQRKTSADYTIWLAHDAADPVGLIPQDNTPSSPSSRLFFYNGSTTIPITVPEKEYLNVLRTGDAEIQFTSSNHSAYTIMIAPFRVYGDRIIGIIEIALLRNETITLAHNNLRNDILLSLLLAAFGILAVIYSVMALIVRPLNELSSVGQRLLDGDLTAKAVGLPNDEFGKLGDTFNTFSQQLENLIHLQERIIADRTRALEITMDVSRRLSTILEPHQLVKEVVEQLKTAFDFYYVQIFFFDEAHKTLILVSGTGQAGQSLLSRSHQIPRGMGLVGRAAEISAPVLSTDVTKDPIWIPNPLLPETRSELAIPIATGNEVLGVLDVQQNVAYGLGEEDVKLLQSIGSQVAIAVQNARSYTETQRRAEREAIIGSISRKIQSATTLDEVLQTAVINLKNPLGAQRTSIEINLKHNDSQRKDSA